MLCWVVSAFLQKEFAIFAQLGRDGVRGGRVTLLIAAVVTSVARGAGGGCRGGRTLGLIVFRFARR